MKAILTMANGDVVRQGEHYHYSEYHELQRMVMPVVSREGSVLHCWGSAVCVGAGWLLTARHVISEFAEQYRSDGHSGLFVMWETDTLLESGEGEYLGAMLPVRACDLHPNADLATLTVELPASAPAEIRTLGLSLRMPEVGEPVVAVGYSHLRAAGGLPSSGPAQIKWERTLTLGVGTVLEQQPHQLDRIFRGSPGFSSDAPTFSGMSGGPVIDSQGQVLGFVSSSFEPTEPHHAWNSYIALLGPALDLTVLDLPIGTGIDADHIIPKSLKSLIAAGSLECDVHEPSTADSTTGEVM